MRSDEDGLVGLISIETGTSLILLFDWLSFVVIID